MELTIHQEILLYAFILAVVMGALVNKTNFCTMGAVSDWVNIGDTGRFRSWLFAVAIAMAGLILLESGGLVDLDSFEMKDLRPPYRMSNFEWLRYILGGVMFGVGMTLASGCGNKTLIRVGGGNLKSVVVLVIASFFAYLMAKTDFYGVVFHSWMNPLSIDLASLGIGGQDLGRVIAGATGREDAINIRAITGGILVVLLLIYVWKSADFRKSFDNVLGGLTVGLTVVAAWYLTGGAKGQEWLENTSFMDTPPRGVGAQSFTFTSPMADTFDYALHVTNMSFVTFGVMALAGVIVGSFLYAVIFRKFRIEWFQSGRDFLAHAIGGVLMGIGGVLALGCTIGQGVTGFSTLAIGSMMAFVSLVFGSALTMKVQYYKMVYENEASFMGALITALVDLKLLPSGMRKLEAV
ncbi:MAG: YeeE/YedE family protein [Gammaproteobacteria bacterium]|nr:YeeE/YedE family protein [Gammaproteobacteria bacterium]